MQPSTNFRLAREKALRQLARKHELKLVVPKRKLKGEHYDLMCGSHLLYQGSLEGCETLLHGMTERRNAEARELLQALGPTMEEALGTYGPLEGSPNDQSGKSYPDEEARLCALLEDIKVHIDDQLSGAAIVPIVMQATKVMSRAP
jgi:hypothetical protein